MLKLEPVTFIEEHWCLKAQNDYAINWCIVIVRSDRKEIILWMDTGQLVEEYGDLVFKILQKRSNTDNMEQLELI